MRICFLTFSTIFLFNYLYAECSDLDSTECLEWAEYCEWNEEAGQCQEIGGGGGPYDYGYLTEADGIRQSSLYNGTLLYYPINAIPPYASIILINAFGDEYGLQGWAEFYASHGFIAMTIGNFDRSTRDFDSEWDYADRALGLLDATQTIKEENLRELSPLFGQVDTSSFAVSGYSTSGGGAHTAATMDSTLKAAILLNPAVAFLDSLNCPPETNYYCLIEEHLNHNVPVLIFSGEYELDELISPDDSIYSNMWALPQYHYVPETTDKLYFESAGEGHGSSGFPNGEIADFALAWLKKYLLDDDSYCEFLIEAPQSTSQFLTTLKCNFIEGRWLWNYGGYTSTPSTMYEFLDGLRYTYYCTENDGCDSTYWNSLDTSDAIPNQDLYTFTNDTLTIDGGSGSFVDFGCDGNIILSGDDIILWRVGLDTSECEEQQLVISSDITTPETFRLQQNYPNPFNPTTTLQYNLPNDGFVNITIYDMLGNVINNLVHDNQNSGYKSVQWDATNNQGQQVSAGVYLYSIETGDFRQTKKMILLK